VRSKKKVSLSVMKGRLKTPKKEAWWNNLNPADKDSKGGCMREKKEAGNYLWSANMEKKRSTKQQEEKSETNLHVAKGKYS